MEERDIRSVIFKKSLHERIRRRVSPCQKQLNTMYNWRNWNRCVVLIWNDAIAYSYCNLSSHYQTIDRVIISHGLICNNTLEYFLMDVKNYLICNTYESKFVDYFYIVDLRKHSLHNHKRESMPIFYVNFKNSDSAYTPEKRSIQVNYLKKKYDCIKTSLYD